MSEAQDEQLRRLFAQSGTVAAEESFVAAVSLQVAAKRGQRRNLRIALVSLFVVMVTMLAAWLAPFAPVALPEQIAQTAQMDVSRIPPYFYWVLAGVVLPLAGTAWLVRRS
jgi:hypothetical protein